MKRNVYLSTMVPEEAVRHIRDGLDRERLLGRAVIPTQEARDRVCCEAMLARCSSPTFHAAAMDGIAVSSESTFAAREGSPLTLEKGCDYDPVNTGHPLPPGRDAVIMVEHLESAGEDGVRIEAPAFPWQHVRRIGEDIVATELLFPRNHRFSAYDVAALLSAGIWEVEVWEKVRVAFIPTGDEVLPFSSRPDPEPGQVIESNSQLAVGLLEAVGAEVTVLPVCRDDEAALTRAVRSALGAGHEVVVVGAGSSAGSRDYTRMVFEKFGQVLVHGITVMPGKPTLAAVTSEKPKGRLLFGAPGYPVSAVVSMEQVLAPVISWLGRRRPAERVEVDVRLTRSVVSKPGMREMVRLAVGRVGGVNLGSPLDRGAGVLTSLTRAQAVARIPADSEGMSEGTMVRAELLVEPSSLADVLVHVGSHDNTLDLLADRLMGLEHPFRLVSSHAGSMGGLSALSSESALFAGAHLFDPESGDFNFPFIERHLSDTEVQVVNLAVRHQGLMVASGNPKGVTSETDLAREDIRFINRQRGSGTRILLDHHLRQAAIDPSTVSGYDQEEFTHMAVAVNVLTGAADCGLGILAAARALGLDFVPLAKERYDLIIPARHLEDERIVQLLEIVRGEQFKAELERLGGYETGLTGLVMRPGQGLEQ